jgi:site-specific recombinase XerD
MKAPPKPSRTSTNGCQKSTAVVQPRTVGRVRRRAERVILFDAGADLAFVKDWLGHANIQNTTIYARLTTATLDA